MDTQKSAKLSKEMLTEEQPEIIRMIEACIEYAETITTDAIRIKIKVFGDNSAQDQKNCIERESYLGRISYLLTILTDVSIEIEELNHRL